MKQKIYNKNIHKISHHLIDQNALFVLETLTKHGFVSYLVGGGVRDLLLSEKPKDFDISTSARPEEIKKIFSNCIIVGKRFRLANIIFGKTVIQVSTFRSGDTSNESLILRDNSWGTSEEDVLRRDFTINGLFYDPINETVIDFVGGFDDLQLKKLKTIGIPVARFKQDPVRMIRMHKFQARLNFSVSNNELEAVKMCCSEITKSSPSRLFEELFKILESKNSALCLQLLKDSGLLGNMCQGINEKLSNEEIKNLVCSFISVTDKIQQSIDKSLKRTILTATLIFPILEHELNLHLASSDSEQKSSDIASFCKNLISQLLNNSCLLFPKKLKASVIDIIQTQYKLTPIVKSKKRFKVRQKFLLQQSFSDSLGLLKIRSLLNPKLKASFEYWKRLRFNALKKKPETKKKYNKP